MLYCFIGVGAKCTLRLVTSKHFLESQCWPENFMARLQSDIWKQLPY